MKVEICWAIAGKRRRSERPHSRQSDNPETIVLELQERDLSFSQLPRTASLHAGLELDEFFRLRLRSGLRLDDKIASLKS